jgi:hypothetical protein
MLAGSPSVGYIHGILSFAAGGESMRRLGLDRRAPKSVATVLGIAVAILFCQPAFAGHHMKAKKHKPAVSIPSQSPNFSSGTITFNPHPWAGGDVQGMSGNLGSFSVPLATPLSVADYTTWTSTNSYTFGGAISSTYSPFVLTQLAYQPTLVTYTQPTYLTYSGSDASFIDAGSADYTVWRSSLNEGVTLTMNLVQVTGNAITNSYLADYSSWLTLTGGTLELSTPTAGNTPEPASICLAATAMLGLLVMRRRLLTL